MNRFTRFISLALSVLLVLSFASTSLAQDNFCSDLSDDDCELLHELADNADVPLSSAFTLHVETDGSIQESGADAEEFAATFDLSGAYVIDEAAIDAAVETFSDVNLLDVNAQAFLDLFRGTFEGFDAELQLDYGLPPEMGVPPLGPFNVWLVDGVGYIDFTPFSAFDPSLTGVNGINIFDLIEVPLQDVEMGDILDALEDMGNGLDMSDGFSMEDFGAGSEDNPFANMMPADISEDDIATFYSVERADDDSVDGVDVVVFVTTLDIGAIMEVDAIVSQAYQSAVESGLPESSEEEFAAAMAEALAGSTMTITEKIDSETAITMQTTIEMAITVDVAPIAALDGSQEEGSLTFNLTMDFTRSDVNNVDAIELPENAQEIPVEALLGGF